MNNYILNHTGIYIHIPFCAKKCPYCDFYSVCDPSLKHSFVEALLKELYLRAVPDKCVDTVYLGGGTPSIMSINDIEKIMASVRYNFNLSDDVQITMEVNPGTLVEPDISNPKISDSEMLTPEISDPEMLTPEIFNKNQTKINGDQLNDMTRKLEGIRKLGVNRLSIGVQSFQKDKLFFLKRIHSADIAMETLHRARDAGFEEISIDLIYGLPDETESSWKRDLDAAMQFNPEHLSCYILTYEPGTPMFESMQKGMISPLGDASVSTLFKQTSRYLTEHGFCHYEVSNFAFDSKYQYQYQSPYNSDSAYNSDSTYNSDSVYDSDSACSSTYESRHNRKYWNMVPYLGFGPSAHSYDGQSRFWNHQDISTYISLLQRDKLPVMDQEILTLDQKRIEMLMLGLRTRQGIDIGAFERLSGCDFQGIFGEIIAKIESRSWGGIRARGISGAGESGGSGKKSTLKEEGHGMFYLNLDGWNLLDTVTAWFVGKL